MGGGHDSDEDDIFRTGQESRADSGDLVVLGDLSQSASSLVGISSEEYDEFEMVEETPFGGVGASGFEGMSIEDRLAISAAMKDDQRMQTQEVAVHGQQDTNPNEVSVLVDDAQHMDTSVARDSSRMEVDTVPANTDTAPAQASPEEKPPTPIAESIEEVRQWLAEHNLNPDLLNALMGLGLMTIVSIAHASESRLSSIVQNLKPVPRKKFNAAVLKLQEIHPPPIVLSLAFDEPELLPLPDPLEEVLPVALIVTEERSPLSVLEEQFVHENDTLKLLNDLMCDSRLQATMTPSAQRILALSKTDHQDRAKRLIKILQVRRKEENTPEPMAIDEPAVSAGESDEAAHLMKTAILLPALQLHFLEELDVCEYSNSDATDCFEHFEESKESLRQKRYDARMKLINDREAEQERIRNHDYLAQQRHREILLSNDAWECKVCRKVNPQHTDKCPDCFSQRSRPMASSYFMPNMSILGGYAMEKFAQMHPWSASYDPGYPPSQPFQESPSAPTQQEKQIVSLPIDQFHQLMCNHCNTVSFNTQFVHFCAHCGEKTATEKRRRKKKQGPRFPVMQKLMSMSNSLGNTLFSSSDSRPSKKREVDEEDYDCYDDGDQEDMDASWPAAGDQSQLEDVDAVFFDTKG